MVIRTYGVGDFFCEWNYITEVLNHLRLDDSYFVHLVCTSQEDDHTDKVKLSPAHENIIICLADEWAVGNIPQDWKDNATTFYAYLRPEHECDSVHALPLGYNKKHKQLPYKPIKSRPIDVFYSGHCHSVNRAMYIESVIRFFKSMPAELRPKNLEVNITKGFNTGLDSDEYSQKLHDSKIVICPAGNVNAETFRHYEAMRSGAVVVSPKLVESKVWKNAAICQVDSWDKNVGSAIMELLSDIDMLQLVQDRQQQTYNNRFTASAVAKYINELLPNTK